MALPAESKDKNATISTYAGYKTKMDLGIKSPLSLIREEFSFCFDIVILGVGKIGRGDGTCHICINTRRSPF
jgi:hypothetical protein